MRLLALIIGLPAAGKTTFTRQLVAMLPFASVRLVCYDEIERELGKNNDNAANAGFDASSWKMARHQAEKIVIETLVQSPPSNPLIVLIDDNFHLRSMRYRYCQIAREYDAGLAILHLDVDEAICIERNRLRSPDQQVPETSLAKMSREFQRPNVERFRWEKYNVTIRNDAANWDEIMLCLRTALENPLKVDNSNQKDEEQVKKERAITLSNVGHQLDIALRRQVNEAVVKVAGGPEKKAMMAQKANEKRKEIIKLFKSGDMSIIDKILVQHERMEHISTMKISKNDDVEDLAQLVIENFDVWLSLN